MRDELKFPKVSSGLLCGMEEDHFCFYESPHIQAAIFIVNRRSRRRRRSAFVIAAPQCSSFSA
jgi:hypothetical protein